MAVPTKLTDLSATAASNSPSGSESIGSSLDDYLRGVQAVLRGNLADKGADIASATTTDLAAVTGLMHDITGTTTITGFGTTDTADGIWKILQFDGALTLTHGASTIILPGGANITTAAGDVGIFIHEGSGVWRCVSYVRAAYQPLTAASDTVVGGVELAIQSEMETGTSTTLGVTPGRQHFHPGHPKAWGYITVSAGVPTLQTSYNITSITDAGTGLVTVTIATDFSSANYAISFSVGATTGNPMAIPMVATGSQAAGSFQILVVDSAGSATDSYDSVSFACYGDQA